MKQAIQNDQSKYNLNYLYSAYKRSVYPGDISKYYYHQLNLNGLAIYQYE